MSELEKELRVLLSKYENNPTGSTLAGYLLNCLGDFVRREESYNRIYGKAGETEPSIKTEDTPALVRWGDRILEVACHGDYSNGVTHEGMDEGRVVVSQLLDELEKEWTVLKASLTHTK